MSCGPTHYAGCPCHEAGWEQRLAAAEERAEKERVGWAAHLAEERGRRMAAEADRDRLAREHEDCDAQRRSLVSQGLAAIRKAEAAEADRDRLREALREMLSTPWGHAPDCEMRETPVEECGCADAPWVGIARRALAASEGAKSMPVTMPMNVRDGEWKP